MKTIPVILLGLSLGATNAALGQHAAGDTVMKGSTIEVIQAYKPQVRQAPKPEWLPQLPPTDTVHLPMNLEVPQQTIYYSYSSEQLRPLALGKDSVNNAYPNYVKAGAGNLSTLYLDAGLATLKGKDYETAIHLHHISQKGTLQYQQDALSGVEAEGMLHKQKYDWHGSVNVERNQFYYYGYNAASFIESTDSVKQTYTTLRAMADMTPKTAAMNGNLTYHPSVSASVYDARFNSSETSFNFAAPFSYHIDNTLQANVTLSGDLSHAKMDTLGGSNSLVELLPGVTLHNRQLSGRGYIGLAVGKGNFYALPDIAAIYDIPKTRLELSGGWLATVKRNTYEELTTENPYLAHEYGIEQTRRDELFANINGSAGHHLTYDVRVSWWNFKNLATFLNDAAYPNTFRVLYDNVSAISFHGSARFVQAGKWSAGASADYYEYYQGSQLYVWHLPSVIVKADLAVRPIEKLLVTAYLSQLGGVHAINSNGYVVTLSPALDLGGSAEYQLVPRLTAFLQISNLLNNKYQRWYGYDSYGFNVYGGLRLKF